MHADLLVMKLGVDPGTQSSHLTHDHRSREATAESAVCTVTVQLYNYNSGHVHVRCECVSHKAKPVVISASCKIS